MPSHRVGRKRPPNQSDLKNREHLQRLHICRLCLLPVAWRELSPRVRRHSGNEVIFLLGGATLVTALARVALECGGSSPERSGGAWV
jgi:hypothetical protein